MCKYCIFHLFQFLAMACGMIRGALANIGVNSVVTAEVSAMPACMYRFLSRTIDFTSLKCFLNCPTDAKINIWFKHIFFLIKRMFIT